MSETRTHTISAGVPGHSGPLFLKQQGECFTLVRKQGACCREAEVKLSLEDLRTIARAAGL